MECKKCGTEIKNGTYCMRCGTSNAEIPRPINQLENVMMSENKDILLENKVAFSDLVMAKNEDNVETGALTWLYAIIVIYSFITVLQITGYILLLTNLSDVFGDISTDSFSYKLMLPLIPVGIFISLAMRNYIEKVYGSFYKEVAFSITRKILKVSLIIWALLFLVNIFSPWIIMILNYGELSGELFKSLWEMLIEMVKGLWQQILAYFVYLGLIVALINVKPEKKQLISITAVISTVIVILLYIF